MGMREAAPTFIRWLWIWITVGALVVVVVIAFLIGIVTSLSSIDGALLETDAAVTGAGGDVKPLPEHIQNINRNLRQIDGSLKPIPDQADNILGALGSIRGRLGSIDSSLVDTNGSLADTDASLADTDASLADTDSSLVDTSGQLGNITSSLVDTSGTLGNVSGSLVDTTGKLGNISGSLVDISGTLRRVSPSLDDTAGQLVTVRKLASRIDRTLVRAQSVRSLGTNAIWRRVRFINGGPFRRPGQRRDEDNNLAGPGGNPNGLTPIKADSGNIVGGLQQVNRHLTSICEAPVLSDPAAASLNNTVGAAFGNRLVRDGPC
jgi:hypothetical protein